MAGLAALRASPRRTRHNARVRPPACYRALTARRDRQTSEQQMTKVPAIPSGRRRPCFAWAGVALMALFGSAPADPGAGAMRAQVYRCEGPHGAIEFRQEPCPPGSQGDTLTIEDRPTGWTLVPEDKGAGGGATPKPRKQAASKPRPASASAKERREQACHKKRQQVEDIDRRLRLGTSGRQGTDLRHRRGRLEDFLSQHCD